jgi:hypothetical protein
MASFPTDLVVAAELYAYNREFSGASGRPLSVDQEVGSFRPVSSWAGERFVFLAIPNKRLRGLAYKHFQVGRKLHEYPNYDEYVGRIAKVVAVERCYDHWTVEFKALDSGDSLVASARSGGIAGMAPLRDINDARHRWSGRTLLYKKDTILTYGDSAGQAKSIRIKKNSPVKVLNVVAGWDNNAPVRFIVELPSGERGFADVIWSGTNSYVSARKYFAKFETLFSECPN